MEKTWKNCPTTEFCPIAGEVGLALNHALSSGPNIYPGVPLFVGGILIGAILSATMLVRRPTDPTSKEPERKGKPARLPQWFVRHLVAMFATAIVLGVLGWKNQQGQPTGFLNTGYGWPRLCVNRNNVSNVDSSDYHRVMLYTVTSWPSLLLDAFLAVVSLIATWVLFSRTQRRCQRWRQLSLSSLFAFVTLAAVICAVLRSESWG